MFPLQLISKLPSSLALALALGPHMSHEKLTNGVGFWFELWDYSLCEACYATR